MLCGRIRVAPFAVPCFSVLNWSMCALVPQTRVKALSALRTYIVHNRHVIPNDGERYRNGEPIATGFVESTVNEEVSKRFCKKQQMQWSKEGAHLLLQTRVRTLNGE